MTDLSAAWAAFEAHDYALAERQAQALLAHPATASGARFMLGYVYAFMDRFDEARASFQALQQQAQKSGDHTAEHRALHQVGMVERMAGNWDAARRCFLEERELLASLPEDPLAASANAYEVATVALHFGDLAGARQEYEKSLVYAQQADDQVAIACAFRGLGDLAQQEKNLLEAQQHWLRARDIFAELEDSEAVNELMTRLNGTEG
ncbi:tetratricopeptide repeat protein [Deinococcus radiodurans]|jgi:hypothetical protein|nr:tetratricopeptide repeat protein [Deinococcus radiodurans]ANC70594.1 hypothetical protein A2G07_01785 [Deinococcus radiodurans R1 = ATCC 13939 = DSM 20539]QIP28025.1 tetratricopeptide repeat protein [Deinococcus radiodurans]QIP31093.1 tetratricopeptide repeat protein [Deinococcus radiodurans]UID71317.1 hypothetical protein DRO_2329 [Deinococcus radiodurans R1 = ATCC 13939 = DSM 20539]UTA51668.1 tetratricopeptide repeat protein [Deinococcus radiodurans]